MRADTIIQAETGARIVFSNQDEYFPDNVSAGTAKLRLRCRSPDAVPSLGRELAHSMCFAGFSVAGLGRTTHRRWRNSVRLLWGNVGLAV